jgi:hypothetical protein
MHTHPLAAHGGHSTHTQLVPCTPEASSPTPEQLQWARPAPSPRIVTTQWDMPHPVQQLPQAEPQLTTDHHTQAVPTSGSQAIPGPEGNQKQSHQKCHRSWASVGHAWNPRYSGGRDQEDHSLKPAQANSLWEPISKIPVTKRAGGMAHSEGPEFKPHYCQKKMPQAKSKSFLHSWYILNKEVLLLLIIYILYS